MYEANNLNHEPTVSIEMIDAATTEEERQALIIKRTQEENQFSVGSTYIMTTPKVMEEPYDGIHQFGRMNDNLLWSFHYPNDTESKPTMDFTVFEFSTRGELSLIGQLDLAVQITSISEHDATCDLHEAISRKGCFDLTMVIKSLAYTDLDTRPAHLERKTKDEILHYELSFKVDHPIQVVWSPYKGIGRFTGVGRNAHIPEEFILNDGLPTREMVKQYYTESLIKSRS